MQFIIDGFREGFDIGFRGDIQGVHRLAPNLKLTVGSLIQLWNKIMKEVKLGRFAGPYHEVSFDNFIQSPIGLVPKSNGDTRLIFHLSYPRGGKSVNSQTPQEFCSVQYPDFSEAINRCLQEGLNCTMAKSDMTSAFRQLGVMPSQWCLCLLVMKAKSPIDSKTYFFVDKALPFGSSISCLHFQRISNSIVHIVKFKSGKLPVGYLDDYFFVHILTTLCNRQVDIFLQVCKDINLPVTLEKTVWATTIIIFLGLLIDSKNQFIGIPVDKIQKAKMLIELILDSKLKKTTVKLLQRLAGLLNFLCRAIVPGRTFVRRLYHYFNSNTPPYHHIRVTHDLRHDLGMWQQFLCEPTVYYRPFLDYSELLTVDKIDWFTDASGMIGCGGFCGHEFFSGEMGHKIFEQSKTKHYLP